MLLMEDSSLKDLQLWAKSLKKIIDSSYGEEMVFYNDGEWYSIKHGRNIVLQEIYDWALKIKTGNMEDDTESYFR